MGKAKQQRPFKTHVAFHKLDGAGNVTETVTLSPTDERPDWVLDQLAKGDKEHLFAGGPDQGDVVDPGTGLPARREPDLGTQTVVLGHQDDEGEPDVPADPGQIINGDAPPQGGPGSAAAHWAAYAKQNGVKTEPDAKREDIIEALQKAGIPVK